MRPVFSTTITVLLAAGIVAGCATGPSAKVRGGGGPSIGQAQAEKYDGPKARIAVAKFINKSAKGGAELGNGMADMLVTSLFQANRFIMLDRQDLDDIVNEQDFAASGRVSDSTAAAISQLEGADLLVMGAVTEFEDDHIGAGGLIIGVLTFGVSIAIASKNEDAPIGAVTYKESYVAIDIKIVDARTGRVVYSNSVNGRYENWGGGIIGGVGGGWSRVPVGLGGFVGAGAEQAIRKCIEAAVADIVKNTPDQYYRVKETEPVILASQLAAIYPVDFIYPAAWGRDRSGVVVIDSDESYLKLLEELHVDEAGAPKFDWGKSRLIAAFAGEKPSKGYRIGVEKAIHFKDALEIQIALAGPPESSTQAESDPDWPFDVVRIDDPGKPIRFVWK